MFRLLFLLFLIVPAIEIALFIEIGGIIGVFATLSLILVTAIVGVALLRIQGLATIARVQGQLNQGQLPATEMLEGLMLLVSGAFLMTPGFFTDTVGFLILIPAIRRSVAHWFLSHADLMFKGQIINAQNETFHKRPDGHHTIEGEFRRKD